MPPTTTASGSSGSAAQHDGLYQLWTAKGRLRHDPEASEDSYTFKPKDQPDGWVNEWLPKELKKESRDYTGLERVPKLQNDFCREGMTSDNAGNWVPKIRTVVAPESQLSRLQSLGRKTDHGPGLALTGTAGSCRMEPFEGSLKVHQPSHWNASYINEYDLESWLASKKTTSQLSPKGILGSITSDQLEDFSVVRKVSMLKPPPESIVKSIFVMHRGMGVDELYAVVDNGTTNTMTDASKDSKATTGVQTGSSRLTPARRI